MSARHSSIWITTWLQKPAAVSAFAVDGVVADVVVLLEVAPASVASRSEGSLDRIEQAGDEFHARVAAAYRDLAAADPQRWLIVDGRGTIDEVAQNLQAAVAERLA